MSKGSSFDSLPWRTLILYLSCLFAVVPAKAQTPDTQQQVGWVSDVLGMRHFNGLRCPDMVGSLFRTKVLAADADRMAGCVYSGRDGFRAILRQHLSGTGASSAADFLRAYKASGFTQVSLSGVAAGGISFKTRDWTPTTLCETLWRFSGRNADFTLWMAYALPTQEGDVGPAIDAFTEILNRQN